MRTFAFPKIWTNIVCVDRWSILSILLLCSRSLPVDRRLSGKPRQQEAQAGRSCLKMIVDLLLLFVSIVVFLYDFLTFPIYWLVQQPWKKRWVKLAWRSCLSQPCLLASPSGDTSWRSRLYFSHPTLVKTWQNQAIFRPKSHFGRRASSNARYQRIWIYSFLNSSIVLDLISNCVVLTVSTQPTVGGCPAWIVIWSPSLLQTSWSGFESL